MLPAHACIWIVSFWISTGRSILTFHFISGTNCGEALSRNIILSRTQHERIERSETRCLLVFCVLVSTCVHWNSCVQMSCKVNLQHQILCWGSQIRDLQCCMHCITYQSLGHLAVFTFCSVESNSTNYWRQRQGSESGTIWNYVASSKANQCLYCWEASGSKRKTTVGRLYMIYMYMYLHVSMNIYY